MQAYHRDLLEQMVPPAGVANLPPLAKDKTSLVKDNMAGRTPVKKNPVKRGRDRKSGSRRHRKVVIGSRDSISAR